MVGLSKKLEEQLAALIERKAFDAYVRHGVVPDDTQRLAETAADGQKFLDVCAGLSVKALPDGRPTTTTPGAPPAMIASATRTLQAITNEAAAKMSVMRLTATAQNFGVAVHAEVHRQITMRKLLSPLQYGDVFSEMSISTDGLTSIDRRVYYGRSETSRLDVYERVNATTACIYDVKTGRRGLSLSRTTDLVSRTTKIPGVTNVIVLQIGIQ